MKTVKTPIMWQYYFARRFSLQRFEIVMRTFTSDFYWDNFRVRLQNILIKPEENGNHADWFNAQEYEQAVGNIFKVVCRNPRTFQNYRDIIKKTEKQWVKAAREVGTAVTPKLRREELGKLYDKFLYWHQEHFDKPILIIFTIESLLAQNVEQALRSVLKRAQRENEHDDWLTIIFTPEEKNAITKAREALLHLAWECKKGKMRGVTRQRALQSLVERFGFIPCYDVIDPPWTVEHFAKELQEILKRTTEDIQAELRKIRKSCRKSHDEFQRFLQTFAMRKRERELFLMAHEFIFLKDDRDDFRRLGSFYGRPLFTELGRRLDLTTQEVCYLSISETQEYFLTGRACDVKMIKERVKGYLLLRKHGEPLIIASGRKMKKILRNEIGKQKKILQQEIRGLVGSRGEASGPAVIIHTADDLRRVTDGAIMIAVTTSPDYVPAMRKCRAIVTDDGGITCHAAIVCRELHIPCIVGTKIGTKIFREGDIVHVAATTGIVRKAR